LATRSKLITLVNQLHRHWGDPVLPPTTDAFGLVLWQQVAYLVDDTRRAEAFAMLQKRVGVTPDEVARASMDLLESVARSGGSIAAKSRAERMQHSAQLVMERWDGGGRQDSTIDADASGPGAGLQWSTRPVANWIWRGGEELPSDIPQRASRDCPGVAVGFCVVDARPWSAAPPRPGRLPTQDAGVRAVLCPPPMFVRSCRRQLVDCNQQMVDICAGRRCDPATEAAARRLRRRAMNGAAVSRRFNVATRRVATVPRSDRTTQ